MSALVPFGKTIIIDPSKALPLFNNGPARAYAATDSTRARGKNLIAIICDPAYVPRRGALAAYKAFPTPAVFMLIANGVCYWPPAGEQRYVIVYELSSHAPVMARGEERAPLGWRDTEAVEFFVKPMVTILTECESRGLFHGNIRLSNLYFSLADRISPIVLGDCLATPAGSTQDLTNETIPRMMAAPLGRGEGTIADDIYAFGVCLAMILRSVDPLVGLREEEILEQKLHNGSFMALAGKDRFPSHILEILRGTLNDNAEQRWKVADLKGWLEGRRLTPQQSYRNKKAIRPIDFSGQKFHFARELAYGMSQNPIAAQSLIESGEVLDWIERSVGDHDIAESIKTYLGKDGGRSKTKGNGAVLVSAIISALEPSFPIFFKDKAYFPNSIGAYCVHGIKAGVEISDIVDMIQMNVFINYLHLQAKTPLQSALIKAFESCKLSLAQTGLGFGFERCVYILCRDAPCLSPRFGKHIVMDIEDLMASVEDLCSKKILSTAMIIDRHIAAFLSVVEGAVIDGRLFDLNSRTKHQNILANLKTFSLVQKRVKGGHYPNLARVLAENLGDLLVRFHDKELRKAVEQNMARAAKGGSVTEILDIIDNPNTKRKDRDDFRRAMQEFAALREEQRRLDMGLKNPSAFGQESGHNVAAAVSWGLSLIVLVLITFFKLGTQ